MGSAPCWRSSSLARLNGLDPKNPRCADSGEGCALLIQGTCPRSGSRAWASRPHRMATRGPPRAASAEIACAVTVSQPLPRCPPAAPGSTVSTLFRSRTPWSAHGERSPLVGRGSPRSGAELLEDVLQAARDRVHVRGDRERQTYGVTGARVGVLADDEDPHRVEGLCECPQDVPTRRQVSAAGRPLRTQEGSQRSHLRRHGGKRCRP